MVNGRWRRATTTQMLLARSRDERTNWPPGPDGSYFAKPKTAQDEENHDEEAEEGEDFVGRQVGSADHFDAGIR